MATAAPLATLEDLAYCPVCFEFYNNPQSLSCRHVLCENCVHGLTKYEQVECPECRHVSMVSEIKKDFNKQNLVEVFLCQQQQEDSNPAATAVCNSCEQPKKIEWSCEECNQTMCNDCNKAHASFPATKKHHVTSVEDIAKHICSRIDETLSVLQTQKEAIRGRLKEEANLMQEVLTLKTLTIEDINTRRESLKTKIDQQHDQTIADLEKVIAGELVKSSKVQENIHSYFRETDKRIKVLSDLKSANNVCHLVENGKVITNDVSLGIQKTEHDVAAIQTSKIPTITLLGPQPWDPTQGTQFLVKQDKREKITTDEDQPKKQQQPVDVQTLVSSVSRSSISRSSVSCDSVCDDNVSMNLSIYSSNDSVIQSDLYDNYLRLSERGVKYKKCDAIKVSGNPWRLLRYGEEIHCTLDDATYLIFHIDGPILKSIKLDKIKKVRSVANDGHDLIVATKDGLHLLTLDGRYICSIRDGKYSDVIILGGVLYAMEYKKNKIVVFQQSAKSSGASNNVPWRQVKTIPLNFTAGCDCDTLFVTKDTITVSSDVSCCVYNYSHKGQQLNKFGVSGVVKPHELYKPRIAGVDENHGLLIADCYNHHVKVCSPTGQWSVVNTTALIKPLDVLVIEDRLWIATHNKEIVILTRGK